MNIAGIRAGLIATLQAGNAALRVTAARDQINPPHIIVWGPDPITYGETFDGGHHLTFELRLLLERSSERASLEALDDYTDDSGTLSVYAAIEADKTLGGTAMSAQVVSAQNTGTLDVNGTPYLSVDFTVDVMT